MNGQNEPQEQCSRERGRLRQRIGELEAQLAQSQQAAADQRQIHDLLPVLVAIAGTDGYYREVNAAFERLLGWSERESLSRPFLEFIHPADRALAVETFARLGAGETATDFVDRNLCKDGSHRWISWTVIPVPHRDIVFGIGQDITEKKQAEDRRKRAEQELQESNVRLEERVSQRTIELTLANEQLAAEVAQRRAAEEKLKAEQQALRRMVLAGDHERRLITYELHDGVAQQILGALMLLESQQLSQGRPPQGHGDAYRDGLAALRQASLEVRRVMNRLRTPILDKYGVTEAIEDVAAQLRLAPEAPEIAVQQDVQFKRLEPTLENSLFRIAQEAMTNACRHSGSQRVQVQLTQKNARVTLQVRDWGSGFDPGSVQENRFGLEGMRERARVLGGKLTIRSKPAQGTVIQVSFPVIEAADQG